MKKGIKQKEGAILSQSSVLGDCRRRFEQLPDVRGRNSTYKLPDVLMSALAMFVLKYPSLNDFSSQTEAERHNLSSVFGVGQLCADGQVRNILDLVDPLPILTNLSALHGRLASSLALKEYAYYKDCHVVAFDGVQYFHSKAIHCNSCTVARHRDGTKSYSHSMVCAVLLCPGKKEVFPLWAEAVLKRDGSAKNDCERNATERLLAHLGRYDGGKFIATGDALYANAPNVRRLAEKGWHWVLNVKPDSHKALFRSFGARAGGKGAKCHTVLDAKGVTHKYRWANNLPLCEDAPDVRVNMLWYEQIDKKGQKTTFTWATDLNLSQNSVATIAKIGRGRWKIENETFNTLKNQGYHFEHNFGHGYKHLSVVLAFLMLLAFAIDQAVQLCSKPFQRIWAAAGTKQRLWEEQRALFFTRSFRDFNELYAALGALYGLPIGFVLDDTS